MTDTPPTNTLNATAQHLRSLVQAQRRLFVFLLVIALFLAAGRYAFPFPAHWLRAALQGALFVGGVLIAPFAFLMEPQWKAFLEKNLKLHFGQQTSPLHNGLFFLLIPILGIFVLTSSRSPLGLGFLWGISAWYAGEAWQMLFTETPLLQATFPNLIGSNNSLIHYILWGYCLYAVLLSFGILLI